MIVYVNNWPKKPPRFFSFKQNRVPSYLLWAIFISFQTLLFSLKLCYFLSNFIIFIQTLLLSLKLCFFLSNLIIFKLFDKKEILLKKIQLNKWLSFFFFKLCLFYLNIILIIFIQKNSIESLLFKHYLFDSISIF